MQGLEDSQRTNRRILSARVTQDTQNHFANDGQAFFGLGYDRINGTSHMVVLFVRLEDLKRQLQCLNYQRAKMLEFLPETNEENIHTYYIISIAPDLGKSSVLH